MTNPLPYLLHLNIQVMEAENKYQNALKTGNKARIQSAHRKLRESADSFNPTYYIGSYPVLPMTCTDGQNSNGSLYSDVRQQE